MSWKRQKYKAIRCEYDGHKFDSKMEAEYYKILMADPDVMHVDVHVPLTLKNGVKLNMDFVVWKNDYSVEAHEVKGVMTQDFKTKRKFFDAIHPLAPMIVLTKKNNKWEIINGN